MDGLRFANILVGVVGAVIGGFLSRALFGDSHGNNGLIASFLLALVGAVPRDSGLEGTVAAPHRLADSHDRSPVTTLHENVEDAGQSGIVGPVVADEEADGLWRLGPRLADWPALF